MELKEIDSQFYCKPKEELCHVTCKGEDCDKIFVTKEAFDKWTNKDYTPVVPSTSRNGVRCTSYWLRALCKPNTSNQNSLCGITQY